MKKFNIWFKKYFTPKGFQVKRIIHEFDFFRGNKTRLKYTAKSRNKKDEIYGNLTDIKIDLKNLNGRQISGLYVALERLCHSSVFKEEQELFAKLISCFRESKSIIHGYDNFHLYTKKILTKKKSTMEESIKRFFKANDIEYIGNGEGIIH